MYQLGFHNSGHSKDHKPSKLPNAALNNFLMNSGLKRPNPFENGADYVVQRKKLKNSTIDSIKKSLNCSEPRGEVIQALHMVFPDNSFNFEVTQLTNAKHKFICYLNIEGYSFIGYGNNKTSAKSSASKIALNYLIEDFKNIDDTGFQDIFIADPYSRIQNGASFSDIFAGLVLEKYNELKTESKHTLPWYKMIAGIIMVQGEEYSNAKVVALSTGTKCIDRQYIQLDGSVIIDSHAEILSRRAFLRFLYNNIENEEDSIFESLPDSNKLKLRDHISFYLFVNSAPCGDCRIFAVSGGDSEDRHPNRISRGLLRFKLDGGNSTVPVNNYTKYQAEGRVMVMSCSDKLLKMNFLGVQGSLLSYFIEPVFFKGIIISDLYHDSHVTRALYGRIEGIDDTGSHFSLHKPSISGTSDDIKIASKSPKTSINWVINESVEILNSINGKTITKEISRLSKRSLFEKFLLVYQKTKKSEKNEDDYFYESFKTNAQCYQTAKNAFFNILKTRNLGKWIDRKPSLDKFQIFDSIAR